MTFSFGTRTFLKLMPRGVGAALSEFRDGCADGDPLPLLFHQERADPLMLLLRIDRREDGHVIRHAGVGDPVFRPVQEVILPLLLRFAAHPGHIGAHDRFGGGKADAFEIAGDDRKVFLPERFVVGEHERRHAERIVEDRRGHAGARRGDLLGENGGVQEAEPLAAVFHRDVAVHEAGIEGLLQQEQGDLILFHHNTMTPAGFP